MRRIQKIAMFVFIVLSVALSVTSIAVLALYLKFGFPTASSGFGFLGIAGIAGLANLIFRKDRQKIQCDERDTAIQRKAALTGFTAAYLLVGLATMLPFIILGRDKTIDVRFLPLIFMSAGLVNFYAWSIAILCLYGWRSEK